MVIRNKELLIGKYKHLFQSQNHKIKKSNYESKIMKFKVPGI